MSINCVFLALQLLERFQEAIEEYKKTIDINDQHQLAYYNLGYIYFNNLKQPREGVKMLKKCLEIDPTDVDAQINMALAFNDIGMIDDVIKSYKYIIAHNSKSVMAHFNLGNYIHYIRLSFLPLMDVIVIVIQAMHI